MKDDYKKIYNDKLNENYLKYNKIVKYEEAKNFSDLFQKRDSRNRTGQLTQSQLNQLNQIIRFIQSQQQTSQTSPVTNNSNSNDNSNQQSQGRIVDPSRMWSPMSLAGRIYEWNRGVLAIDILGRVRKEKLDGTNNHHTDATERLAKYFGIIIDKDTNPFIAGVQASEEGLIIFQSEGDNGLVYFPESITEEQAVALTRELIPRQGFNFSYAHGEEVFEEQDLRAVLSHVAEMLYAPKSARR